jgi:hypothetical protein
MSVKHNTNGVIFSDTSTQSSAPIVPSCQQIAKTSTYTLSTLNTWTDIPGASITVTPKSTSSKFLLTASTVISGSTSSSGSINHAHIRILRNGSVIGVGNLRNSEIQCLSSGSRIFSQLGSHFGGYYLDSPSTTSGVTYKLQVWCGYGTIVVGGCYDISSNHGSVPTTLTAMEILQ